MELWFVKKTMVLQWMYTLLGYGTKISAICRNVQEQVKYNLETMLGFAAKIQWMSMFKELDSSQEEVRNMAIWKRTAQDFRAMVEIGEIYLKMQNS